jgi:exosortase
MTNKSVYSFVRSNSVSLAIAAVLGVGLLWSVWPALAQMNQRWAHDPRYSHGYLVPLFSLVLLWLRRDVLAAGPVRANGWGSLLLAVGAVLQLTGARYYLPWIESISILPYLAGLTVLAGGWRALRWAAPAIGFLFFMVPLPYRLEMGLGYPLQRVATLASNYALQTLGLPAVAEGNVIHIDEVKIGVVEACNGLGMLFTFFAFAVGTALIVRKGILDKALIVLSAVPIALAANVTRITATGLLHVTAGSEFAEHVYHDLAGWLMMPLAVGALWVELLIFSHMFIEETDTRSGSPVGPIHYGGRR